MFKTCRACGETKSINEFYDHPNAPDGKEYQCKTCKQFRYAPTGKLADSTYLVLCQLARLGVPACARTTTRTYWNWNKPIYTDIVAFGIVLIEAKISRSGKPMWVWTTKERKSQDDIAILGHVQDDAETWYIFDNASPVFYHDANGYKKSGKTPEHLMGQRKHGISLSDRHANLFAAAKDNWDLVFATFERKAEELRAGAYRWVQEVPVRE